MLPNEFKARLIMLNWTQQNYADYVGVHINTVNKWLNATTIPRYATLCLEHAEMTHTNK